MEKLTGGRYLGEFMKAFHLIYSLEFQLGSFSQGGEGSDSLGVPGTRVPQESNFKQAHTTWEIQDPAYLDVMPKEAWGQERNVSSGKNKNTQT